MTQTTMHAQPQTPTLFQVTVTVNTDGPADADAIRRAFSEGGPFLASPLTISSEDGYMSVLFAGVDDDPTPWHGNAADAAPGADIVGALAGFSDERSLAAALIKALLTVTSVREAAGLAPRSEIRIDAVPAPALRHDSVSQSHSDGTPDTFPEFRPRRRRRSDVAPCGPPR